MALNIPMPESAGSEFTKALSSGGNLFHQMILNQYYGQLKPSGDVANALYVENLRNQYGENDPRYLNAKRAHEMQLQSRQSLMDYRGKLSDLAPYRAATPEEKLIHAARGQGVLDTFGGDSYANDGNEGEMPDEERQVYNQALGKKTTDAAIRNKIPYAKNVRITMESIDPDALVQYSGPQGKVKLGLDSLKAGAGEPSQEFMNYQRAVTSAKTLSKQLRQFWGDSIQPSATKKIDELTNPSSWHKNPQVAKQQFEQLKAITDQELETFETAGTSPLKLNFNKKTGSFYTSGDDGTPNKVSSGAANKDMDFARAMSQQLIDDLPNATPENILKTAKKRGVSVQNVVDHLVKQALAIRNRQ